MKVPLINYTFPQPPQFKLEIKHEPHANTIGICGYTREMKKGGMRICRMRKYHVGQHFDTIPFKPSPEKFYGSAKAYDRQVKK